MTLPKGYRRLRVGEVVRPRDKFSFRGGAWLLTTGHGFKVTDPDYTYIRRVRRKRK